MISNIEYHERLIKELRDLTDLEDAEQTIVDAEIEKATVLDMDAKESCAVLTEYISENGEDKKVHQYDNAGSFGELALMYNTPRAATIIAASEGIIWGLDRTTFKNIVVRQAFKKRQLYESLLEEVPVLKELTTYERMNVADALKARSFKDGEYIIRQGEEGDEFY